MVVMATVASQKGVEEARDLTVTVIVACVVAIPLVVVLVVVIVLRTRRCLGECTSASVVCKRMCVCVCMCQYCTILSHV